MGPCQEKIQLSDQVQAEGNIEDWLVKLEKSMQASVRVKCKSGAQDCYSMSTRDYSFAYPSQIALLGIQILWTQNVGECLERSNKEKIIELDKKKKFLNGILADLTKMCLEEMNKQLRTRVETIVTIHVRQLEIFNDIRKECYAYKIKDGNDFSWTKNTRCVWRQDDQHVGVNVTDVEFTYSYEFLGAKERLCITPLTDRCYVIVSSSWYALRWCSSWSSRNR
jgi:dynein heavy chain